MGRERVAIIGFTSHRARAAYEDPSVDLWGLNDLYIDLPVTMDDRLRWFQIHEWQDGRPVESVLDMTGGPIHPRDPNHVAWLKAASDKGVPVYLREPRAEVPNATVFPFEDCYKFFGKHFKTKHAGRCDYFTNSISFMIGLAIMEGYKEIGIYGVDMMVGGRAPGSEYGWQRPSCELFIGIAAGMGITVDIPHESDLTSTAYAYGDSMATPFRRKVSAHVNELKQRQANLNNQAQSMHNARMELQGAINLAEWLMNAWMPGDSDNPSIGTAPQPDAHVVQMVNDTMQAAHPQLDAQQAAVANALMNRISQLEANVHRLGGIEVRNPEEFAPVIAGRSDEDGGSQ